MRGGMRVGIYGEFNSGFNTFFDVLVFEIGPVWISVYLKNSSRLLGYTNDFIHVQLVSGAFPDNTAGRVEDDVHLRIPHRFHDSIRLLLLREIKIRMNRSANHVKLRKRFIA